MFVILTSFRWVPLRFTHHNCCIYLASYICFGAILSLSLYGEY